MAVTKTPEAMELAKSIRSLANLVVKANGQQEARLAERRAEEATLLRTVLAEMEPAMRAVSPRLPRLGAGWYGLTVDSFRGKSVIAAVCDSEPGIALFALDDENPPRAIPPEQAVRDFRLRAIITTLAGAMETHALARREFAGRLARETKRIHAISILIGAAKE